MGIVMLRSRLLSSCFRIASIASLLASGIASSVAGAQGIVGAWSAQSGAAEGANVVVFLANGYYIHIQNASPSAAPSGVDGYEHGTYTWDAGTGAFTVTTLTDTNGNVGLSGASGMAGINVVVAGDTLTAQIPGVGAQALSRVGAPNPIVGPWLDGSGTGAPGTKFELYVFFADGTYLMAQQAFQGGGIEHGTYVWVASTGSFSSSRTPSPPFVDTNGQVEGLSWFSRADTLATVSNNGTRLSIADSIGYLQMPRVGPPYSPPPANTVVEYYHAVFGHYFITSLAAEVAALDAGTQPGWARTGYSFNVYAPNAALTSNVCRFFSTSFAPKSSHFYTATECATVRTNPDWLFEGEVFAMRLPNSAGECPAGTVPLYRLYNNGRNGAPNHRYTTRLDVRSSMLGEGFVAEGVGIGVGGCVLP